MPEPQPPAAAHHRSPSLVEDWLERLLSLRQHSKDGVRRPSKPLLVLLALGRLQETGTSSLRWDESQPKLSELIAEFGPPSRTGRRQAAAYPFTHLRSDGVWSLSHDVPMDRIGPLDAEPVTGRLALPLEHALLAPGEIERAARAIVESQFPSTVAPDVLASVGLDPELVLSTGRTVATVPERRRSSSWPAQVLAAWDQQCAFCRYDGRLGNAVVGLEAAHVRWFTFDGPDDLDNGLALCSLHHKLFDRGALGLDASWHIVVSRAFTARSDAAQRVYDLHGQRLRARPGTPLPDAHHVQWHTTQVFKVPALSA
ncbi:MAG TPA: HNH endonuclease [Segeticoccus sp.]|uniref:phosphorothioated DNA-binding restriction endonuclease n=1 Tax=Segeticoccus sp. TaxID=2706531 RepID=UPI002D7E74E0|nr:HNH endonuclease [Segeticoccus sp.]HET8602241.1 HNH endonuclease [Segeticoccus sp.]